MKIRTQVKAGIAGGGNHSGQVNHSEALKVRSSVKADCLRPNHNEALKVRSTVKAGMLSGGGLGTIGN